MNQRLYREGIFMLVTKSEALLTQLRLELKETFIDKIHFILSMCACMNTNQIHIYLIHV